MARYIYTNPDGTPFLKDGKPVFKHTKNRYRAGTIELHPTNIPKWVEVEDTPPTIDPMTTKP